MKLSKNINTRKRSRLNSQWQGSPGSGINFSLPTPTLSPLQYKWRAGRKQTATLGGTAAEKHSFIGFLEGVHGVSVCPKRALIQRKSFQPPPSLLKTLQRPSSIRTPTFSMRLLGYQHRKWCDAFVFWPRWMASVQHPTCFGDGGTTVSLLIAFFKNPL